MMDKYKINSHKLLWHPEEVSRWLKGELIVPIYIDMGITQGCNMACSYCYYSSVENISNRMIPNHSLIQLLSDAADVGVKAVGFLGDGEPMIHPGVYDAIRHGKKVGLDMSLSTNGLRMDHSELPSFLDSLTWIRFNLSALSAKSFYQTMGVDSIHLKTIEENIRKSVEVRDRYGLKTTIGIQMVLTNENIDQIVPLAMFSKNIGANYFMVKQCAEKCGTDSPLVVRKPKLHESIFLEAEALATKDFSVIVKREKMNAFVRSYDDCYGCSFITQITGAGELYSCGNHVGDENYLIGSIIDSSFKNLIKSERFRNVLNTVRTTDVHKKCGIGCRQNEINEYLEKLKSPPPHINFI